MDVWTNLRNNIQKDKFYLFAGHFHFVHLVHKILFRSLGTPDIYTIDTLFWFRWTAELWRRHVIKVHVRHFVQRTREYAELFRQKWTFDLRGNCSQTFLDCFMKKLVRLGYVQNEM
jgi:hypothetical protein